MLITWNLYEEWYKHSFIYALYLVTRITLYIDRYPQHKDTVSFPWFTTYPIFICHIPFPMLASVPSLHVGFGFPWFLLPPGFQFKTSIFKVVSLFPWFVQTVDVVFQLVDSLIFYWYFVWFYFNNFMLEVHFENLR